MRNLKTLTAPVSRPMFIATLVLAVLSGCAGAPLGPMVAEHADRENSAAAAMEEENSQDAQQAISSQVPNTDILLFAVDLKVASKPARFIGNVTNRPGYDNQPRFIPGTDDFLFSSIIDGRQSDVYRYRSSTGALARITDTPLSEYSPTPLGMGDFSCVTVEEDGAQRLWRFDQNGKALGKIRADLNDVGYHAFLPVSHSPELLAVFRVTDPVSLAVVRKEQSLTSPVPVQTLATGIGRSLHAIPASARFSFVQHAPEQPSMLMQWISPTNRVGALIAMPDGVEDMTWSMDGRALAVVDGRLLSWTEGDQTWSMLYDLKSYLPFATTRLAINDAGTRLAVVMEMEGL